MENFNPDEIAFIYAGGHRNTVYLVDSLGIKMKKHLPPFFSGSLKNTIKSVFALFSLPKNYKFYFVEGNFISLVIARKLHIIPKDSKIIKYLGEPIFYRLLNGETKGLKKRVLDHFLKEVDAFVCHGEWQVELLSRYMPNAKKIMVYTPILPDVFNHLKSDSKLPKLNSHSILFIGNGRVKYKGLDLAIGAFKKVKESYPDAKFNIIGKWDKKIIDSYKSIKDMVFLGYVPDLLPYIKNSALYVHPARGEAFGLSIIEAMLGGLPALVSNDTGAKVMVQKVSNKLVVDPNLQKIVEAIEWYFKLDNQEKIKLSKKAVEVASEADPNKVIPKFRVDFSNLINKL
jgi:glycosyltransferase involved in cell wall biosynthesis